MSSEITTDFVIVILTNTRQQGKRQRKGTEQKPVDPEGEKEEEKGNNNYNYNEVENDIIFDINDIKINVDCNYEIEVKDLLMKYKGLVSNEMRVATSYVHRLQVKNINNFKAKTYQCHICTNKK
ncbi:hypothetical protein NQ317_019471 [Molorchus minor]|uniref:Uncharacterized protein n=1 Tax=Molorchus minor TaxID=1323400 RepID=A0ABQ9JPQ5_9CUCU|nr:hypothetical protein NQ317_019471 [Molorchus minor]